MKVKNNWLKRFTMIPLLFLSIHAFAATVSKYADLPSSKNDAVSLDSLGKVYVSHAGPFNGGLTGTQVYMVELNGNTTIAHEGLSGPLGNAFDSNGNMYVSNYNTGGVSKFSGDVSEHDFVLLGSGGGIVIDSQDHIFVSSYFGNAIYRLNMDGSSEVWVSGGGLNGPVGLALDEDENLYVANYNDGKIFKVDSDANITQIALVSEGSQAYIGYITYAGNAVYATGFDANKIFKVSLDGAVEELAGTEATEFKSPNGIAASVDGKFLYVSEYESKTLYQIDLSESSSGGGSGSGSGSGGGSNSGSSGGSGGGAIWLLLVFLSAIAITRTIVVPK